MKVLALPAFQDNYLWLLHDGQRALVVDPGDARPVRDALRQAGLQLHAILVTHHHPDHVGGVEALHAETGARVWGPARESVPAPFTPVAQGDRVDVLGLSFSVLDVPGHTAGHIAYYCESIAGAPRVFCGDTLFAAGCGRLFEGTPAQMLDSLDRLAALPDATRVHCAHEYTLSNVKFALAVEPDSEDLLRFRADCEALRARGEPTVPTTLGLERRINPFLRARVERVAQAAHAHSGAAPDDPVAVFAALRQWKNEFR